jgi:hypothetical protein
MDTEQSPEPGPSNELQVGTPPGLKPGAAPKPSPWRRRLGTIAVGAVASFVVMALLYGLNNAIMVVGLLVICTVGIGLIPIVLVSWLVGWILLAIWDAMWREPGRGGPTVAPGGSGG